MNIKKTLSLLSVFEIIIIIGYITKVFEIIMSNTEDSLGNFVFMIVIFWIIRLILKMIWD